MIRRTNGRGGPSGGAPKDIIGAENGCARPPPVPPVPPAVGDAVAAVAGVVVTASSSSERWA
jgi:hypothetical protein